MNYTECTITIGHFFDNYFKNMYDNYNNETFWKISHKQQFVYNFMSNFENRLLKIQCRFPFGNFTIFNCNYKDFKIYYETYYNSDIRTMLVSYFLANNILYELFIMLKNILLNNNIENNYNNIRNDFKKLCLKYTSSLQNHIIDNNNNEWYNEIFVSSDNIIGKYLLNLLIVNIFCAYQQLLDNNELCKTSMNILNNNIESLKITIGSFVNNSNGMNLNVNTFQDINPIYLHNSLVWFCFKVPDQIFNELHTIYVTHLNYLHQQIENKNILTTNLHQCNIKISNKRQTKKSIMQQPISLTSNDETEPMDIDMIIEKKKYKKTTIPPALRKKVWNKWIGETIGKAKCLCCNHNYILQCEFSCGHVQSEFFGGKTELDNLKPICKSCNSSIGVKHMDEYMTEFGFK